MACLPTDALKRGDPLCSLFSLVKPTTLSTAPAMLTSQPVVLTPEPPGTLASKWATYKNAVQSVLELVVQREYKETKSIIKGLDNLVREISQLLLQQCVPASTTVFYGLPLSVTATRTGTKASVKWSNEYSFDHWVIDNEMNLWVAWRQETSYFFYVMDHKVGHDLFSDTLKRGDALLSKEMFACQIESSHMHGTLHRP